jgi:Tfp pilus assembly protein PilF
VSLKVLKRALPDLAILLLVVIVYIPAFQAGFIWDDDAHLTENQFVIGQGGLRSIWTSSAATYYPLVLTSFWFEHAIWGLNPFAFHVVNVLMHALCAILLRHVLLNLGLGAAAAWLGAVFWGLHPVQAESAAWVTELKNTQSGLFYLLALLLFLKWRNHAATDAKGRRVLYVLFFLSAALALLSKTSTVMLPVVIALCAWWLDGRWQWRNLKVISPFLLISAVAGGWTIWEQKFHSGAVGSEWTQRFFERIIIAGYSVWFYAAKLILPYPLMFIYPRWTVSVRDVLAFLPFVAVLFSLLALWWFRNGMIRPLFFVWAYFVVSLFPVLDFFDIYFFRYSFVGDHFQYLASMGPLAFCGAGIVWAFDRAKRMKPQAKSEKTPLLLNEGWRAAPGWLLSGAIILILGILTFQHATVFHNNETLWRDTIARNSDAWLAHNNLATIFMDRGDSAAAAVELETTLRLQPNDAEGHANLANIFFESGRFEEAAIQFELALQGEPDYARIHDYLGVSLMETGRLEEGVAHMRRAVEIAPANPTAREHLGLGFWRQGKIEEAMAQFKEGVRVDPAGTAPRMRYGTALLALDRYSDAEVQFREILHSSPEFQPAHKFLGIALSGLHQTDRAMLELEEALRLDPNDGDATQKLNEIRATARK